MSRWRNAGCEQSELQIVSAVHRQFFDAFRIDCGRGSGGGGIDRRRFLVHCNALRHSGWIQGNVEEDGTAQRDGEGWVQVSSKALDFGLNFVISDRKRHKSVRA